MSCFDDQVMLYHLFSQIEFAVDKTSPHYYISCMASVTHKFKGESTSELPKDGFSPLCISIKTFPKLLYSEN